MTIKLRHFITTVLISTGVLALQGCASGIKDPVPGSPTVAEVYGAAMLGRTTFLHRGNAHPVQNNYAVRHFSKSLSALPQPVHGQRLTLENSLNAQFPTLPNPKSVMYVFGHYASAGAIPVAGHFVPFSLYTRTYYALPNEVLAPYNDGQFVSHENKGLLNGI